MIKNWISVGRFDDVPRQGARRVQTAQGNIAIFRTADDQIYALEDRCPHKAGPLSQGIVHGSAVACPLHNWSISLVTGQALGADKGCTPTIDVKREGDEIFLDLDSSTVMKVA
jgi:nitrite reductase (NADH) small subunit